ncbi:MAG: hexose kinase [Rhizomicrobium sp.]
MAKVVTFTPNPAVDIATGVEELIPAHKLRCGPVRRDPGGGGINVARVVHRLGGDAVAVYAAGGGAGDELAALLDREAIRHRPVRVAAHTRESFNVTEERSARQFRFVLPGEPLSEGECNACIGAALGLLAARDYFVASGSLPPGVPDDFYARAIRAAKAAGARTVIDTQGPPLGQVLGEGVGILKGSARELSAYLGAMPADLRGWQAALAGLIHSKKVSTVIVTLGEGGALLVSAKVSWHAAVPRVDSSTTVGAGDSFLGGLLVKLAAGAPDDIALGYAAAAGTAALLTSGTGLCAPADVERLCARVELTAL